MHHQMKLQPEPFNQIKSGTKTIEVRLFDEKRQQIVVDDTITFSRKDSGVDVIETRVTDLVKFNNFADLFNTYDREVYGAKSAEDYTSMYQYYSKEAEEKYGVLAIHLQVV
jgi:ASC-1-like (ASCH) protein